VVRPELADDPDFIRRFDYEAQIIARLEHPHIVPLFDYWREPGGAYLVMRYLRGGTAEQLVESQGALSVSRVSRLVDEVGSALATAHSDGVVHRDVKPANILFDEQGGSYLADFGIATGVGSATAPETGSMATSIYTSPEQARLGEAAASSDIYAFGSVLFELLSSESPFPRDTPMPALIELKRRGAMPRLTDLRPELPEALDEVIRRATAPDPGDRFGEISELVLAFHSAVASTSDTRPAGPPSLIGRNPYKGLSAFNEADAADFYGREELVVRLYGHTTRSRFLAVVGPSGSGKSSAVRAGLAPRMRASGAYVISMIPGHNPIDELTRSLLDVAPLGQADAISDALRASESGLVEAVASCLPDPSTELVLIVDQFEELFTVSDVAERDAFIGLIADAATRDISRVRVVATIRADFYDRPLSHRSISEMVQANTIAVTPLSPAELERAITGPAARVGVAVEPGLVAALIADSVSDQVSLPIVQYKLTRLFDRRDGHELTLAEYLHSGGLTGAVARRADELYEESDESTRNDVRRLFGRLVTPGEGAEDTRRRVPRSEVAAVSPDVIAAYGDARLLSFDRDPVTREPTVEVAHEALIREWPRLRRWLAAVREGLRIVRHVAMAADAWTASNRDPDELYRGGRLETFEDWMSANPDSLNVREREFVEASVAVRDAELAERQRRYDEQVRSNRRLRRLLVGVGILSVIAMLAGVFAFQERGRADDEAAEADFGRLIARARTLSEQDLPLAMLAAVEAFDRDDRAQSRGALQEALMAEPRFAGRMPVVGGANPPATEGPDAAWFFMSRGVPGAVATEGVWYDSQTLEPMGSVTVDDRWGLTSSPDRSLVAALWRIPPFDVEGDPRLTEVRLHDDTGRQVGSLPTTGVPGFVVFLSDQLLVVADLAGLTIWDVPEQDVVKQIEIPDAPRLTVVDVSPDGSTMLVSSPGPDSVAILVDLVAGVVVPGSEVPCEGLCPVRFDPAGERVAIGEPGGVVVRDVVTWEVQSTVVAPDDVMQAVDFSDDGTTLYLGTADADLAFYDAKSGDRAAPTIRAEGDSLTAVMAVPGGQIISRSKVGISLGLIQRWMVDRSGPFGSWLGSGEGFGTFTLDGSAFVRTNDPDVGWVTHYDSATAVAVESIELAPGTPLGAITFSPDGRWVAVAELGGDVSVYDAATFEATGDVLQGLGLMFLTFSPDGRRLAIGSNFTPRALSLSNSFAAPQQVESRRFAAHIWDIESGQVTPLELTTDFQAAGRPTWNPDGTQVALSDVVGGDALFDAETGRQVGSRFSVKGRDQARDVLWEADGEHLLGVGGPGLSRWDVSTGERTVPFTELTAGQWMDLAEDGTLLVTASQSSQARLWDLEAASPLGAALPDPGLGWVAGGQFQPFPALSSDGQYLAMTGANGTVLWSLDPQLWRDRACQIAGRNMTQNEWINVMGRSPYRATCARWPAG
jgi:WD40 repeat protein